MSPVTSSTRRAPSTSAYTNALQIAPRASDLDTPKPLHNSRFSRIPAAEGAAGGRRPVQGTARGWRRVPAGQSAAGLAVQRHGDELKLVTAPEVSKSVERHLNRPKEVALPDERLEDVRAYLEHLHEAGQRVEIMGTAARRFGN
jgi:hypothetical protein